MHEYLPPPIAPVSAIWTNARATFARLRANISVAQWLYALEALVRKLVFLEALALAPTGAPIPPARMPFHLQHLAPDPPPRGPTQRGYAFRLWPRAKPHPARMRLLGRASSTAEHNAQAARQAQLDRMQQARTKRASRAQTLLRRLSALRQVLDKPLPYAQRLARKLKRSSKKFLMTYALKRPPRSPYIEAQVQADTEKHCWAAARAKLDAGYPSDTS